MFPTQSRLRRSIQAFTRICRRTIICCTMPLHPLSEELKRLKIMVLPQVPVQTGPETSGYCGCPAVAAHAPELGIDDVKPNVDRVPRSVRSAFRFQVTTPDRLSPTRGSDSFIVNQEWAAACRSDPIAVTTRSGMKPQRLPRSVSCRGR